MDDLFEAFRFCITDNGCKGCPREETCKIRVDYVPVSKVLALDVLNRLKEQEAMNVDTFMQWCVDSHIMGNATVRGIEYWVGKFKEGR